MIEDGCLGRFLPVGRENYSIRLGGKTGVKGSRTPDLVIANDALYQLSYDPLSAARVARRDPGKAVPFTLRLPPILSKRHFRGKGQWPGRD